MVDGILNGIIEGTTLGYNDHKIFSFYLMIKFDGSVQGFGGYTLDDIPLKSMGNRQPTKYGMAVLMKILQVLNVDNWEDLNGTSVRVERKDGLLVRLGHFLKDDWVDCIKIFEECEEGVEF